MEANDYNKTFIDSRFPCCYKLLDKLMSMKSKQTFSSDFVMVLPQENSKIEVTIYHHFVNGKQTFLFVGGKRRRIKKNGG